MHLALAHLVAAAPNPLGGAPAGTQPSDWFWSSAIGIVVWSLLSAVGIIVILRVFLKMGAGVSSKKGNGHDVGVILFMFVIAAYCFYPPLINTTIQIFVQFTEAVLSSIGHLFGGGSGGGGVTTTT